MAPAAPLIRKLLVANRGEIAIRILHTCHELPQAIETVAIYTSGDSTHVSLGRPSQAIKIPSPSSYMDIAYLVQLCKDNGIDAVHPGYGFLSESAEFSAQAAQQGITVIGPGAEVLARTGDKLAAKALAMECEVPVLKAMSTPTGNVSEVKAFADKVGYPVMVKAVDGGGGRGIRLVRTAADLESAVSRAIAESPSKRVFAEQAAVDGFKHIEIQIIGDGRGGVKHLWERDCSVQRRFQKIVEVAPAPVARRRVVSNVIESAIRMARKLKYKGLGTWEYLVNVPARKFFFLEINPRLQVEHTISEEIAGVDLVREQLHIAMGVPRSEKDDVRFGEWWEGDKPPAQASIQLRLCAEDPTDNFKAVIGKVTDISLPSGRGVRVDTHLSKGGVVGSDFDNMMAKIIVTAGTFEEACRKATRALAETSVQGVKTNLNLLRAIVQDPAFVAGNADTSWLEKNIKSLVEQGEAIGQQVESQSAQLPPLSLANAANSAAAGTGTLFRKGDAWTVTLEPHGTQAGTKPAPSHLLVERITRNEFPTSLVADVSYTSPGQKPQSYKLNLASTTASAEATASTHRRGDPSNKQHIVLPISGKLVEILVEEGDVVEENEVLAYVKQMKMELEVRAPRGGMVKWAIELENEEGDDVAEGVLLVELEEEHKGGVEVRSRL